MSPWWIALIVAFLVFDAVVIWWFLTQRRMPQFGDLTLLDFGKMSKELSVMVKEHMERNYSGQPEQLPELLPDLLSRVQSVAISKGVRMERKTLKQVVGRLIVMQGSAEQQQVDEAMKRVA